ncbi:predicted protein [Nematostella vectensis]|uniref:Uncharacterized protein n=1 Tax=Nematostella vectensis TaxID=45351 RepID=A7SG57_NEMVE|nr:predicted protein [Nematostella vectensis]|eukprot:XP_001629400.1 predicted protein [Nematostella vectensis]
MSNIVKTTTSRLGIQIKTRLTTKSASKSFIISSVEPTSTKHDSSTFTNYARKTTTIFHSSLDPVCYNVGRCKKVANDCCTAICLTTPTTNLDLASISSIHTRAALTTIESDGYPSSSVTSTSSNVITRPLISSTIPTMSNIVKTTTSRLGIQIKTRLTTKSASKSFIISSVEPTSTKHDSRTFTNYARKTTTIFHSSLDPSKSTANLIFHRTTSLKKTTRQKGLHIRVTYNKGLCLISNGDSVLLEINNLIQDLIQHPTNISFEEAVAAVDNITSLLSEPQIDSSLAISTLMNASRAFEKFAAEYGAKHLNDTNPRIYKVSTGIDVLLQKVLNPKQSSDFKFSYRNNINKLTIQANVPWKNIDNGSVILAVVFKNFIQALPSSGRIERSIDSHVLSLVLHPNPRTVLNKNVTMTFDHNNKDEMFTGEVQRSCAFWKFATSSPSSSGSWSTDGCTAVSSDNHVTTCSCNHLTNFAILMQVTPKPPVVCVTAAAMLQLFLMAALFWMLLEGIQLYLQLVRVYNADMNLKLCYLFAWGIPVLVVGISFAVIAGSSRGIQSYTQPNACWISYNYYIAWTFVVPAALVIVITISILSMRLIFQINSSIFFRVLKELSNMSKRQKRAQDSYSIVRNLKACIVLFPVLGITWSIGFVNMLDAGVVTMYLFTILNSTQGLLIFILHCALNLEIRAALRRKLCRKSQIEDFTSSHSHKKTQGQSSMTAPSKTKGVELQLEDVDPGDLPGTNTI